MFFTNALHIHGYEYGIGYYMMIKGVSRIYGRGDRVFFTADQGGKIFFTCGQGGQRRMTTPLGGGGIYFASHKINISPKIVQNIFFACFRGFWPFMCLKANHHVEGGHV